MVGLGMIFDETYRPFFEHAARAGLYDPAFGVCDVRLAAVASRTGRRAEAYRAGCRQIGWATLPAFTSPMRSTQLLAADVDFVCVATPDDRHFEAAKAALSAGKHVLIEKPSVLSLARARRAGAAGPRSNGVLAKVVYHKLLDPDHKKLRTLVADGELKHVNNGYCSLLEPKSISGGQFAEWITGRNPGTYVAVHYIKLIDFTFGGRLKSVACTGQRGLVGPADGPTWDSTQLRLVYEYDDGREAAFDIHTSWVTPDNFPGYVEQEVQFRFDNGVWNAHSRKRGVECTVEGRTPLERKITMNNHYNGTFLEPWGERSQRGYGIEVLERFVREVAYGRIRRASDRARSARLASRAAVGLQRPVGRSADRGRRAGDGSDPGPACRRRAELRRRSRSSRRAGWCCCEPAQAEHEVLYARTCTNVVSVYGECRQGPATHAYCISIHWRYRHGIHGTEHLKVPAARSNIAAKSNPTPFAAGWRPSSRAALRTFTPSLAVLERSAGSYHWTPEGRKLADFTSGVLVTNLGHNPARWWRRVIDTWACGTSIRRASSFVTAVPLTAYNAVTELETHGHRDARRSALLQSQPGGARCEQVLWAASGSEAIQKALWAALDRRPGENIILATRHGFHGKKGLAGAVTGSETDPERDPRVRFIGFPREECINIERRRQPLDLAPYIAELSGLPEGIRRAHLPA